MNEEILKKLKKKRKRRRDLEQYVHFKSVNKWLWVKTYTLFRNMAFSLLTDINDRIAKVSSQYNALLDKKEEMEQIGNQLELDMIQLSIIRQRIKETKENIRNTINLKDLREALKFYEKI